MYNLYIDKTNTELQMIYVLFSNGNPVHVTSESPYTGTPAMKEFPGVVYDKVKCSPDYESFEEVQDIAVKISEITGQQWIAYDDGEWTSHRFGIMEPPKVGDEVSYGFNGDYYPCGTIAKITKAGVSRLAKAKSSTVVIKSVRAGLWLAAPGRSYTVTSAA